MSLLYFFWCTPREITAGDPYGACDWLITREMAVSIVLTKHVHHQFPAKVPSVKHS